MAIQTGAPPVVRSTRGYASVIPKHSIFDYAAVNVGDIAPHTVGDRLLLADGRVFHYALNYTGAALAPGKMCQAAVIDANFKEMVCPTASAAAVDYVWATLGGTAVTANMFANGYVYSSYVTGNTPFIAKIRSHVAQTTTTGNVKFNTYDPLPAAVTVTAKISVVKNLWQDVVVVPLGGQTGPCAGVPLITIPVSTATILYYGWLQTWGDSICLGQGTVTVGQNQGIGGTADGASAALAAYTTPIWGVARRTGTSAYYNPIFLTIAP